MCLSLMRQKIFTTCHRTKSSLRFKTWRYERKVTDDSSTCCNASSSINQQPVIIKNLKKPRCFKGVEIEKRGIAYTANSNAWMNGIIFDKWMHQFNLRTHGRKELLFLDNASSRKVRRELNKVTTVFYRLTWLPSSILSMQLRINIIIYILRTYIYGI